MDSQQVSDLMDRKPLIIGPEIGVIAAMRRLLERKVSGAAVVDDKGLLLGVLSEADCLKGTLMGGYFEQVGELVGERMTREVCSVTTDTNLIDAAELMLKNKRRLLPVIEGKRVVGVLSRATVIEAIMTTIDNPVYA